MDVRLPDAQDAPSQRLELPRTSAVTLDVRPHLGCPIRRVVTSREPLEARFQVPAVPEVPITEDHHPRAREHDVRAPR
jgi:hypothetical protein